MSDVKINAEPAKASARMIHPAVISGFFERMVRSRKWIRKNRGKTL